MDIQYSVKPRRFGNSKRKNQEPSFRTFYNIVYNVRSVYKNVCLCSHAERASDIR